MAVTNAPGSGSVGGTSDKAALCWHCQKRSPDPAAASRLRLRRYGADRAEDTAVVIPSCAACASARRRIRALWWALVTVALVTLVAGIVVSQVATGVLGTLLLVVGFTAPFVLVLPIGLVGQTRLTKRAGIVHPDRVSFPEVALLRRTGWTTVRLPLHLFRSAEKAAAGIEHLQEWADRGPSVRKTCSKCHAEVPIGAHAGQSCPHCGAHWGKELSYTVPR